MNKSTDVFCCFEFDKADILKEEVVSIKICVDPSDTLHCFMGEQELAKHSLSGLPQGYFSLERSVNDALQMLQDGVKDAEKEKVPLHSVMNKLSHPEEETSMLVRALYNMMEQDRFESKRHQVGSMRNDIDVFTTKARNEGVNLSRIQDKFGVIRSRFFNRKTEEAVVNTTVENLNELKK